MPVQIAPNGRAIWLVEGVLPTDPEWEDILKHGMALNVLWMPDEAPDLEGLFPWAGELRYLAVNSYSCSDLRAIERMPELESLIVGGRVTKAPGMRKNPRLREYLGPLKGFENVLTVPSLRFLQTSWSSKGLWIEAPVENLTIVSARTMTELDVVEHPEALKSLTIERAARLNVGRLADMPNLERLHFENCRELVGVAALASIRLKELFLENCIAVDDQESLRGIAARVRVIGKNPFDAQFQASVSDNWSFPQTSRPARGGFMAN